MYYIIFTQKQKKKLRNKKNKIKKKGSVLIMYYAVI